MKKGIFIVIDGVDGSGKATQTKLLIDALRAEGHIVETISFPQYGKKSAGPVEEYLSGAYGNANDVGPYATSILFAVDRFDAAKKIQSWIEAGSMVIADRYVGSNMGHQGAKISDPDEQKKFFTWDLHLEHEIFKIPKPDLNLVLHVSSTTSKQLLENREAHEGSKHHLKKDVHEADAEHLAHAEAAYLTLCEQNPDLFRLIECEENGILLSPEEIHQLIRTSLRSLIS
ncbi:MAG: thymidylate kinase [Patescibacteria group bacterium]|jgi:dTMP kinase